MEFARSVPQEKILVIIREFNLYEPSLLCLECRWRQQTTCSKMKGQSQNWVVLLLSLYTSRLLRKLGLKSPAAITFVPAAAATHVVNKAQPITKEQGSDEYSEHEWGEPLHLRRITSDEKFLWFKMSIIWQNLTTKSFTICTKCTKSFQPSYMELQKLQSVCNQLPEKRSEWNMERLADSVQWQSDCRRQL